MVLAHSIDSWTHDADRHGEPFYTLFFIGGVASPLFLFLAGLASAMSAASKSRRDGCHAAGARAARRRGWEIFGLGLIFRVQSQLLGMGPLQNLLKVDMLNVMGLSIVAATYLWQAMPHRRTRVIAFSLATAAVTFSTPLIRAAAWLTPFPDAIEAYLRPAGALAAFPLFPWAGFLFAGALVGDLIDHRRIDLTRQSRLQLGVVVVATLGVWLGWRASFAPALFPAASFWHDSPTFFFIRLGLCALTVPVAFVVERLVRPAVLMPVVTLGRSSLFVYWIHVEMVYGVIAEPIKQNLPIAIVLMGTTMLTLFLYLLVLLKNRLLDRHELRGPFKILAPVIR